MDIIAPHKPYRQHHEDSLLVSMLSGFKRQLRKFYRRARALLKPPIKMIDEVLWRDVTQHYIFIAHLSPEENRRLRLIASDFLSRKNIYGAAGFTVTESMQVQIAAQACMLILELGADAYDGWADIIIYPAQFRPRREFTDAAGVVHMSNAVLAGEAWLGGPVVLSYADVASAGDPDLNQNYPINQIRPTAHNVVIHEFAHKFDMRNGNANGFPPLPRGMRESVWKQTFMAAYLDFCERTDHARAQAQFDGGAALRALPIDAYASENPAEFFAVLSESFFLAPQAVAAAYPKVYAQLARFYRQDPATRHAV